MTSFKASSFSGLILLTCLVFSSIVHSLPVPKSNEASTKTLEPRVPSPRMMPSSDEGERDNLFEDVLTTFGLEKLAKLNHWKSYQDPDVIDDSKSQNATRTEHGNEDSKVHEAKKEEHTGVANPATDPMGFMSDLFHIISHGFKEAWDSSDEVTLQ